MKTGFISIVPGRKRSVGLFTLSVLFPILIGIAGHFGFKLGGGVTLTFDVKAEL